MAGRKEYELLFKLRAALGGNFNAAFRTATKTIKSQQNALSKLNSITGKVDAYKKQRSALESNRQKLERLTAEHERLQRQMSETAQPSEELRAKMARNERQIAATTAKIEQQGSRLNQLGRELSDVGVDTSRLIEENERLANSYERIRKSQEEMARLNTAIGVNDQAISKTRAEIAGTMGAIAASGVALYVRAIKPAIEFESAFAGVKKTIDATPEQLSEIQTGIRKMATEIPSSVVEISAIAEAAGQLGIQTKNVLKFTRTIADLGVTTNMTGDEAASTLAKLANITGMSQENFDRLGSTIVALGNHLATTEADIAAMGMRLAGAGSQVGMSEAQILSLAGALSSVGIEAEAGGSAFSKVMVNMQLAAETGGESLQDFAKVAGMSSAEFKKAYQTDAAGALIAFIKGLSNADERGVSAIKTLDDMGITEVRMRDALLRAANASDVFSSAIDLGNAAWEENIALQNEAVQRYATTESSLEIMRNAMNEIGISIGSVFLPHLATAAKKVTELTTKLSEFAQKNPKLIEMVVKLTGGLLAFKAATLTAKLGFLELKGGALMIQKVMALVKGQIALAGAGTVGFASKVKGVAKSVTGYFGGIGSAAGGVGRAFAQMFSGTKIGNLFSRMGGTADGVFTRMFSGVGGMATRAFSATAMTAKGVFGRAGAMIAAGPLGKIESVTAKGFGKVTTLFGPLQKLGGAILEPFSGILGKVLPVVGVVMLIISAVQTLRDNLDKVREVVGRVFGEAGLVVFDKVVAAIFNIGNTIKSIFTDGNLGGARDFLINLFGEETTGVIDGAITVLQTVWNILSGFIEFVNTYVRPIVEQIFTFIVETVLPQIAQAFAEWAPTIASILQGFSTIVSTVATAIMSVIQCFVTLTNAQEVVSDVMANMQGVVSGALMAIKGIVDVFAGIFTGDWSRVWDGVKEIFRGVWDSLESIARGVLNGIIGLTNGVISGLNKLKIPDWIPGIGGKGINIPLIPAFAKGTKRTPDTFIAGEAGPELITNAKNRTVFTAAETGVIFRNLSNAVNTIRAGKGIPSLQLAYAGATAPSVSAPSMAAATRQASIVIHSAPVFHVGSEAQAEDIEELLRRHGEELLEEIDERQRQREDDERRQNYD